MFIERNQKSGTMKKKAELKIKVSFLVLWFCSLTAFVYAGEPGMPGGKTGEDRPVRSVSATESKNPEGGILPPDPASSSSDSVVFLQSGSQAVYNATVVINPTPGPDGQMPVVLPDGRVIPGDGSVPDQSLMPRVGQSNEQKISALVDEILSRMADAGLREDLSKVLTYISVNDYAGLADFQKEHPEILNKLSSLLPEASDRMATSTMSTKHNVARDYVDSWLGQVKRAQEILSIKGKGQGSSDLPVDAVVKLYQPIAKRIAETAQSLEEVKRVPGNQGDRELPSGNLLKNFSAKARRLIVNSLDQAQANLANGMLSDSLEPAAFGAETPAVQGSPATSDPANIRAMTSTELYVKSREYHVVDSVYIGKSFIYAQKMLHPPANLHPYLKWLLYVRNLTPAMMEQYLATRESVAAIYAQAKAGQGNIRYKGKIYGAFLPFAETAAGNYELVKPASPE
jgi:hypothetical protein